MICHTALLDDTTIFCEDMILLSIFLNMQNISFKQIILVLGVPLIPSVFGAGYPLILLSASGGCGVSATIPNAICS